MKPSLLAATKATRSGGFWRSKRGLGSDLRDEVGEEVREVDVGEDRPALRLEASSEQEARVSSSITRLLT